MTTISEHANINGGLGNRLFIIANLFAKKTNFCVCNADASNKHSTINYKNGIFKNFPQTCSGCHSQLSMFYQDYKAISSILSEYIEMLNLEPEPEVDAAFLHIRGGDYINNSYHYIPLEFYYDRAIRHFPKDTLFYIFTNDRSYAERQPILRKIRYEFVDCDELTALSKMKQCKRGGICANSSFSWWGAILDQNRTLVIPSRLTNDEKWNAETDYTFPGAIVESVDVDVYCINLAHRIDRKERIRKMISDYPSLNLKFVDAVYDRQNGLRGCLLSHKKILQSAKDRDLPYTIVIEDDCDFLVPESTLVRTLYVASEYLSKVDVVNCSGNLPEFKINGHEIQDGVVFLKSPVVSTTHFIVYGKSSYDRFLSLPESDIIDVTLNKFNMVYTYPYLGEQCRGYSDIINITVFYDHIRKSEAFVKSYLAKVV